MQTSSPKKRIPLMVRVVAGLLVTLMSLVGSLFFLMVLWMRAMRIPWFRKRLVRFNRSVINPKALQVAGRRANGYASLAHIGRRSGHTYTTPIVAREFGDGFIIPLPYGTGVDWCRNVLAAKTCTLTWNGQEYTMERPEVVPLAVGMDAFPLMTRVLFTAGGMEECLWLHKRKGTSEKASQDRVTPHVVSTP